MGSPAVALGMSLWELCIPQAPLLKLQWEAWAVASKNGEESRLPMGEKPKASALWAQHPQGPGWRSSSLW